MKFTDFKNWTSVVLVLNIEDSLHNIYPIAFKCSSGNAGRTVSMIHKRKFENIPHSLNSMGPIVSMEMALAEVYFKGSHIMEWVKSLNSFEKSTLWHSFIMVNCFKN